LTNHDWADDAEVDFDDVAQAAIMELIEDGEIDMVGRTATGDAVFASTVKPSWGRRLALRLRFTLIVPALLTEYVAGYTALGVAALSAEPPDVAVSLGRLADRLHEWHRRVSDGPSDTVWPSIRAYEGGR
jgi:hypothetical protein